MRVFLTKSYGAIVIGVQCVWRLGIAWSHIRKPDPRFIIGPSIVVHRVLRTVRYKMYVIMILNTFSFSFIATELHTTLTIQCSLWTWHEQMWCNCTCRNCNYNLWYSFFYLCSIYCTHWSEDHPRVVFLSYCTYLVGTIIIMNHLYLPFLCGVWWFFLLSILICMFLDALGSIQWMKHKGHGGQSPLVEYCHLFDLLPNPISLGLLPS